MTRTTLLWIASLLLALPARAAEPGDADACLWRSRSEQTSVQTVVFRATDRVGAVTESRAKIHWKRFDSGLSRLQMRFSAPPDLRGAALLLIEKAGGKRDMFMYLPELGKVKRVTGRMLTGSMFGTDFSYEDFERLQGFTPDRSASRRLPDVTLDGASALVMEILPPPSQESAYGRIVTFVDRATCVPIKLELYEGEDRLRKVATTPRSEITREGGEMVPRRVHIEDVRDGTHSELIVEEIELGVKIPKKMFSQRELESGS